MIKSTESAQFHTGVDTPWRVADVMTCRALAITASTVCVAMCCSLTAPASAQQSNSRPAQAAICNNAVVIANVPTLLKRYLNANTWLNLNGALDSDSNDQVTNIKSLQDGTTNFICRADVSLDFIGVNGDKRHADIRDLDFTVEVDKKGVPAKMETYQWPKEPENKVAIDLFLAKWTINGKPLLPQIKAAIAASPRPTNVMEAMSMMNNSARAQAEQIARQQGFGGMLDAEAARRARMTPKERAAEDAYNAGPVPGETICIVKEGVRRCKTGR